MISIDIDKTRSEAARLREIGLTVGEISSAVEKSSTAYQTAWQGDAGTEFQALAARVAMQLSLFSANVATVAKDITLICDEFEAADVKV